MSILTSSYGDFVGFQRVPCAIQMILVLAIHKKLHSMAPNDSENTAVYPTDSKWTRNWVKSTRLVLLHSVFCSNLYNSRELKYAHGCRYSSCSMKSIDYFQNFIRRPVFRCVPCTIEDRAFVARPTMASRIDTFRDTTSAPLIFHLQLCSANVTIF